MSQRLRVLLVSILVLAIILAATHAVWLSWMGYALVTSDEAGPADAVVVLGGDYNGQRIRHAAGLVRQGLVPTILVSGGVPIYGVNEADLAIAFAQAQGLPRAVFSPVYMKATSTEEECQALRPELEARGIRRVVIVTSNYHTARAARICRKHFAGRIEARFVAAPDRYFTPDGWWRTREGQKTVFFEYLKTIANWLGH